MPRHRWACLDTYGLDVGDDKHFGPIFVWSNVSKHLKTTSAFLCSFFWQFSLAGQNTGLTRACLRTLHREPSRPAKGFPWPGELV
jgi:hypothetical protein